jgi:hypothetical protein
LGDLGVEKMVSTREFHSEHCGQRPDHLACSWPQDWQIKRVLDLGIKKINLIDLISN